MSESPDEYPSVVIVMLRQPKSHADESRTDPYWEFGSFGTTGCHWRSVMNRGRIKELEGKRFAFAQGGHSGFRLVHVTPPLSTRYLSTLEVCEARWSPSEMPLRYDMSPCLIDNTGQSNFPLLIPRFKDMRRSTWVGKFSSAFRTSRLPLAGVVGAELMRVYQDWRTTHPTAISDRYIDALPFPPPRIDSLNTRRQNYKSAVRNDGSSEPSTSCRKRTC